MSDDFIANENFDFEKAYNESFKDVQENTVITATVIDISGDTVFLDFMTQNGVYYYYTVKAIDSTQNESEASDEIRSRTVSLDGGILIVDETADGNGSIFNPTDEAVDSFYAELLQGFLVTEYNLATEAGIKLADLGAFSSVVWHGDDFTEFAVTEQIRQSLQ